LLAAVNVKEVFAVASIDITFMTKFRDDPSVVQNFKGGGHTHTHCTVIT